MAFSDFTRFPEVLKKFDLTTSEKPRLFSSCAPLQPNSFLTEILQDGAPLASSIGTEKARSELIVAPLLLDVKRHAPQISLFSGVDFSVQPETGLTGTCDFLLSRSPEQLFVKAPVVTLVEAKNESIKEGLGQCVAEMVAAQIFNQREGNAIPVVYGAVTTGTLWKFLSLSERTVTIDMDDYSISQVERILGILVTMTSGQPIAPPAR